MMTELTEYAPIGKMKQATYLPAVFRVAAAIANPRTATERPAVICHVRSCKRPDDQPINRPPAPARRKGGQVMTSVMVVLKPRVLTTLRLLAEFTKTDRSTYVGKKLLNEQAERWKHCMSTKIQVFGSRQACLRPSMAGTSASPMVTLSRTMREWASSRSSSVNQRVVLGVSGRSQKPPIATPKVTIPSSMKSLVLLIRKNYESVQQSYHLHPEIPCFPSRPAKIPAAIREENPVAVI